MCLIASLLSARLITLIDKLQVTDVDLARVLGCLKWWRILDWLHVGVHLLDAGQIPKVVAAWAP